MLMLFFLALSAIQFYLDRSFQMASDSPLNVTHHSNSVPGKSAREEEDKRAAMCVQVECSMCGDVGLRKKLFRCSKCCHRYQHTYCSNWYPQERSGYAGTCNWCADIIKKGDHEQTITDQKHVKANVGVDLYEPRTRREAAFTDHQLIKKTKRIAGRRYKLVSEV